MQTANFSHPGCYARELRDCSQKLSREHYVSASVLRLLGEEHTVSNARWLPPGQHSPPLCVGDLGSRILCERHNSVLSSLDASAEVFFAELLRALSEPVHGTSPQRVSADGDLLELWVLKACCGAIASGSLIDDGNTLVRDLPRAWLNILFSRTPWEEGTGLHIGQAPMTPYRGYEMGPMYLDQSRTLGGGGIEFAGVLLFVLLESGVEKRIIEQSTGQVIPLIYRPGAITIESPKQKTEIELRWPTWVPTERVLYCRA